ncbi:N-acyl-D-glucosamine 2-epimerase [Pontibacter diazotrophicus]|uniref:Cellobiose 2-epimerase n=1 Tax=Pontibacter diazotrophicus TaxID=1400979 RepID=A0A3D8LC22_9BACT|nr:AGE family epimerase/isomerase [Pontibacter diazotrophicus]RDV14989.1 N-acyl-D-glucosamine 2-epimerase [Pontibacter diazotrophicus]
MHKHEETEVERKLKSYRQEAEAELENILAFWMQYALDEEQGGFVGKMDNKGNNVQDAPKGGVLNARILWSFSAAYHHTKKEEYLKMADRAYDYLMQHFWDETYGGTYWSVDAKGKPLSTRKQIYALAFVIYGLSEYHMATQNQKALESARALFYWIEKHSFDPEQGGYFEAFSREGDLLEDLRLSEKDRNDPKTMNTHLHILEAYANLYRVWPDQHLGLQLEALLEVFLQHIVEKDGHMKLFLTKDWKPTADLVSFGHDIEASWLLQEAAEVLGKKELTDKVKAVAVAMAKATATALQSDGSLYHELNRDGNHYDKHREWWVSAEAMVGFLNAYEVTNDTVYLGHSWNAWQFSKAHLLDKAQGEWFWGVNDDYSLMEAEDKIGFWKCPYHNTRACLEVVHRCDKLAGNMY